MFAPLAQTPRPPGEAGRYECIRRGREAPPNLPTAGAGAGPGGARGWVQRGAFLAPEGRSKRSRRAGGRGRAASMARAAGAGTRLPRRETGARGGGFAGRERARGLAVCAAACRKPRFLRLSGARNACAGWGCGGGPHPWRERWARSEKKGGRAGGRGPLYACRGTKKNFSVKEILFINEKKFFSGRGKDEESPPPLGRRAKGSGGNQNERRSPI